MLTMTDIRKLSGHEVMQKLVELHSEFVRIICAGQGTNQAAIDIGKEVEFIRQHIETAIDFYSLAETAPWECQCGAKGEVVHVGLSFHELNHRIEWSHREKAPNCPGYLAKTILVARV